MTQDGERAERGSRNLVLAPPPTGTGTKGRRTRAQLLNTAVAVFAERGLSASSVVDITRAAGVSNGTFYRHFLNKEELVAEVGGLLVGTVFEQMYVAVGGLDDYQLKAAVSAQWFIAKAVDNPELGALMAETLTTPGPVQEHALKRLRHDLVQADHAGAVRFHNIDGASRLLAVILTTCTALALEGLAVEDAQLLASESGLRLMGVPAAESIALSLRARALLADADSSRGS